jgi:uncharacterized protein YjbI with pentapeptide repeats
MELATLIKAVLCNATFAGTDLTNARCQQADFQCASFSNCGFEGTQLSGARLMCAQLHQVDLSNANWSGVSFANAQLRQCNLEYLNLPSADFSKAVLAGCLFTGSRIIGGIFTGANLRDTGLAEVHWENADLREADLTHASFHLGSSRSGLVGSTIAGEGSRTGFYTDDYNDREHKDAEEIRKACLRGANLRPISIWSIFARRSTRLGRPGTFKAARRFSSESATKPTEAPKVSTQLAIAEVLCVPRDTGLPPVLARPKFGCLGFALIPLHFAWAGGPCHGDAF